MHDAFISYSHSNDKQLAGALQSVLQRLGVPWYARSKINVFVDDTSLAPTPELWPSIVKHLTAARYLIYLASPQAASSPWVCKEIEWWMIEKGPATLIIVLTEGLLSWDSTINSLKSIGTSVLPAVLESAFPQEPLWVDVRNCRSLSRRALKRDNEFVSSAAGIAALLRGVPKETVFSEELRQQRKALATAWSAAGTLAILVTLVAAAGLYAWHQRNRSESILNKTALTANSLVFDLYERFRTQLGTPDDLTLRLLDQANRLSSGLLRSGEFRQELALSRSAAMSGISEALNARQRYGDAFAAANEAQLSLAQVANKFTTDPTEEAYFNLLMGVALEHKGDAFAGMGKLGQAEEAYRNGLLYYDTIKPLSMEVKRNKAVEIEKLGSLFLRKRDFKQAKVLFDDAHSIRQELFHAGMLSSPDVEQETRDLAVSFANLGKLSILMNGTNTLKFYLESLKLSRELASAHPEQTSYQADLVTSLREVGEIKDSLNLKDEAKFALDEALSISRTLTTCHPDRSDWMTDRLATALKVAELGEPADLLRSHALLKGEAAVAMESLKRYGGSDEMRRSLSNLFFSLSGLGADLSEARADLQHAIDLRLINLTGGATADDADALKHLYFKLSETWVRDNQPQRALEIFDRYIDELTHLKSLDDGYLTNALSNAAWYAILAGDIDRALAMSQRADKLDEGRSLEVSANYAHALMFSGQILSAKDIYLKNVGKSVGSGSKWEEYIMADFTQLSLFRPQTELMKEIRDRFSIIRDRK